MFDDLNRYEATTHFNGQSTIALEGDRATGESYCLAHHLFTEEGERKLMVAWLRYTTFVKRDGTWLFADESSTSTGPRPGTRFRRAPTLIIGIRRNEGESVDLAFEKPQVQDLLAFPGEEPPQIECNEDASAQGTDE